MILARRIIFSCLMAVVFVSCRNDDSPQQKYAKFQGKTMGTYYSLQCKPVVDQEKIDSILVFVNSIFSTYIEDSTISEINRNSVSSKVGKVEDFAEFIQVFQIAKEIHKSSKGSFDPTVKPLVDYWGFGKQKRKTDFEQKKIDSLLQFVGFDKMTCPIADGRFVITKEDDRVELDFSAIAKGYGVDVVADYLDTQGVSDYIFDIGGETRTKGVNKKGELWTIGINKPEENSALGSYVLKVTPGRNSIASSGNYRSFYEVNGKKFNHTINPKSGMAVPSDLLAISVIHEKCVRADAIATACMSMGLNDAKNYILELNETEAVFFYQNTGEILADYSENFKQYIVN